MGLNKTSGNMYPFVTHTWNPIRGKCAYECKYCYVKSMRAAKYYTGTPRLIEKKLKTNLGQDNIIFVGNMIDMFADNIPCEYIIRVLEHCKRFHNKCLFQTKNPRRFWDSSIFSSIPKGSVLGTTIETNRIDKEISKAPTQLDRTSYFDMPYNNFEQFVTIEPIMDFDLTRFITMIKTCDPNWVTIGADSKKHNLPEPLADKIYQLIFELKKFTRVIQKDNLKRLLKN